jgi:hypothetical protein
MYGAVRSRTFIACVGVALLSWFSASRAQPVISEGKITFDQTEAPASVKISIDGTSRERLFGKTKKVALRLDDGASVGVQIGAPNRVLFAYSARDIVATDTADKVAADKLADAIAGFIQEMGGGPKSSLVNARSIDRNRRSASTVQKVTLEDIDLVDMARRIEWVMNTWDSAPSTIEDLVSSATNSNAISVATTWQAELKNNDPSRQINALPGLWRKLISPTQVIRCRIEYADGTRDEFLEPRATLVNTLERKGVENAQMYVDVTMAFQTERKNLLAQVTDVRDLANAITSTSAVSLVSVDYVQEKDQELIIDVKANPRFASFLGEKAKAYQAERLGAYSIVFSPYELIHMRPSLGIIYSFVKSPKFSAERNAEGDLTIAGNTDEYTEYGALVAMDFVPDRYFRKGIQPYFQVGVSPKSDNLGVAVGIGIRAYKAYTLSIGAVYQRVDKLASGLAVGDVIEGEDDLKKSKEFKLGFYLGVGVKLQ